MAEKVLVDFVKEARRRKYSELEIREAILSKGWPAKEVEKVFAVLEPKKEYKNQVCLFLNDEILGALQKRAKKNLFTLSEQIEDILRRSCMIKSALKKEKLDDFLLTCFSRQNRGRK